MKIQEIKAKDLKPKKFIDEKVREIREIAGDGIAISALSGGVDSSVVTALAHKALGKKLKTYFIDNGIMREGEPRRVKALFAELGIPVTIVDARRAFFDAMKGITDPELKREAITQTFYKKVFRDLVLKSKATVLLQGTILTDVEETAAGIKRQHNVFEQIGIDPKKAFGYKISEPLIQLRQGRGPQGRHGPGAPEIALRPHPLPGACSGRPGDRRGDADEDRARAQGDGHRRGGAREGEGLPVHGDPARGPRHGDAGRQTGLRPAGRDPLLGQRRCPEGHAYEASLADARADRGEDPRRSARCGERDL